MPTIDDLVWERDLYKALLQLGSQDDVEAFLAHALELIAALARARSGYIELWDPNNDGAPHHWTTHGVEGDSAADFQQALSSGVIQSALAAGQTVITASALTDPRFAERESVKRRGIEAVLCCPIGRAPSLGVLYLQGRDEPGRFKEEDRERAELCARQIAPLAERLMLRRASMGDPTAPWRAKLDVDDVVGHSRALATMLEQVALCAPLDISVMLVGATGTGKTHVARVIHRNGKRAGGPFIELNCAAIPDALMESELFGAEKGAHSTATQRLPGKVSAAEGGTLFLDEVGELSAPLQSKLLQLLQSKQYFALGGTQLKTADVRIIAATNEDLRARIEQKTFREDLYYRLQVLPIRTPTLAERPDDIMPLAQHACVQTCTRYDLGHLALSVGAIAALEVAEWSGNVRQLAHTVQAGAIRAAAASMTHIEPSHLFPERSPEAEAEAQRTLQGATKRFQRDLVRTTLRDVDWNVTEAARRLDVARSYLYKLINALGLRRGD